MVGVDDDVRVVNDDLTTEHYITIVGMGEDSAGKYFVFYDNTEPDVDIGTSDENKLYCKPLSFMLEGTGDLRNGYVQETRNRSNYSGNKFIKLL